MYNQKNQHPISDRTALRAVELEEGSERVRDTKDLLESGYSATYVDTENQEGGFIIVGQETSIRVSEDYEFIQEELTE